MPQQNQSQPDANHLEPHSQNHSTPQSALSQVVTWLLISTVSLLPIIIVPLSSNLIIDSKFYLTIGAALLLLLAFLFHSFKNKGWQLVLSPVTPALAFFTMTALASSLLSSNYPVENLLSLGGVYIAAGLIALIGPSLIKQSKAEFAIKALTISASILSLSSLLELVGFGPSKAISLLTNLPLAEDVMLYLSGSAFLGIQIIGLALLGEVAHIFKQKKLTTFHVITIPLLIFGLGLSVWTTFIAKKMPVNLHPLSSSWSVALDSLRLPKSALIGQGPAGYINAFQKYKPAWLNSGQYWQTGFSAGTNTPLTLIVQLGLLGLAAWLMLAANFYLKSKKQQLWQHPLTLLVAATFGLQLLTPTNYVLVPLQALLLAFWTAHFKDRFPQLEVSPLNIDVKLKSGKANAIQQNNADQPTQSTSNNSKNTTASSQSANHTGRGLSLVVNSVLTVGVLILFYFTGHAYAASHHMLEAQKALVQNKGVQVYNHQRLAVALNRYLDVHRRSYAQTNLQIATALSNKTDATQQEQQQVSQLIKQAVREARAATTIDPGDVRNWSTLANIYQELVGNVEEADQWTVNAYVKAIQTSPTNPLLRIQLSNLLLQQKKIDQASNLLTQAVNLKPDLAASHYHLGNAQLQNNKLLAAQQSWQQALQLLNPETEDYQTLDQQLQQLQQKIDQATQSGQLAAPGANAANTNTPNNTPPNIQGSAGAETPVSDPATPGELSEQDLGQELDSSTTNTPASNETDTIDSDLDKPTPLGQELPSLTDQNLESSENTVNQPQNQPLELENELETENPESESQEPEEQN